MRKTRKEPDDKTSQNGIGMEVILREEEFLRELNFRRFKSQTRSMIESSNSPNKRAALST